MDETALRIAIAMALGLVLIATIFLTGAPRSSVPPPAPRTAPAPPPRIAHRPVVQVELTQEEVKRQLAELSALLLMLDQSPVPKEKVGPLWREVMAAKKSLEEPSPDLAALSKSMRELESKARALLPE